MIVNVSIAKMSIILKRTNLINRSDTKAAYTDALNSAMQDIGWILKIDRFDFEAKTVRYGCKLQFERGAHSIYLEAKHSSK